MSFIYLIIYFLLLSLKQLSNIFLKNYQTINKENFLKKFLSIMSSNTFFTHTIWILFFSKFYFDRFVFEFISIIYMGNLIILNLVKCIIIFNALRKKII